MNTSGASLAAMPRARRGQIALLLAFVLAAIALFALLDVDVFTATRSKFRLENAGDAAAIAAARRQGELLNAIGRLNLRHIAAAAACRTNECEKIVLEQKRLALVGPVKALELASKAAAKNGMRPREEFAKLLREHAAEVRRVYSGGSPNGGDPYPEPYPGAWTEYATAIENACEGGLCAGPDNMRFRDSPGRHLLTDKRFYQAVGGRDWCWFHFNADGLLDTYRSFRDWAPLPENQEISNCDSEIFPLRIASRKVSLLTILGAERIAALAGDDAKSPDFAPDVQEATLLADPEQEWFFFDSAGWRQWFSGRTLAGEDGGAEFPLACEVRPEYNVMGCAAVCRCITTSSPVAVSGSTELSWSAAAKPFGFLQGEDGTPAPANSQAGFVLPCFTDARLVPVDSVDGADLTTADAAWTEHVRRHVPRYLEYGPISAQGCQYCMRLQDWELASFRFTGAVWLKMYSGTCRRGSGGGGSGHGGTARGH